MVSLSDCREQNQIFIIGFVICKQQAEHESQCCAIKYRNLTLTIGREHSVCQLHQMVYMYCTAIVVVPIYRFPSYLTSVTMNS